MLNHILKKYLYCVNFCIEPMYWFCGNFQQIFLVYYQQWGKDPACDFQYYEWLKALQTACLTSAIYRLWLIFGWSAKKPLLPLLCSGSIFQRAWSSGGALECSHDCQMINVKRSSFWENNSNTIEQSLPT